MVSHTCFDSLRKNSALSRPFSSAFRSANLCEQQSRQRSVDPGSTVSMRTCEQQSRQRSVDPGSTVLMRTCEQQSRQHTVDGSMGTNIKQYAGGDERGR